MGGLWMRFLTMLLGLLSCNSDNLLTYEVEKEIYVEVPTEVIEDEEFDFSNIWVDSITQIAALDGVDIFWVIDPSGSMQDDQERILNGIALMMSRLPEVGWRLMILPSDYSRTSALDTFPIVPGDSLQDVEDMYNLHMEGSREAGFDALYEYVVLNPYSSTWLRNDESLLVVFVSDEEEQSDYHFNNLYEFIGWASSYRQNVFMASIVNVDAADSVCGMPPTTVAIGYDYMEATNFFGGNIIDICAEDWSAGVADASTQIVPYEFIELTHTPLDPNWIFVYANGAVYRDWYYEPSENRVYFTVIPDANTLIEVAYNY